MRVILNKDGDFLSQFDNINENDIPALERLQDLAPQIRDTPHQKKLINSHTDANKGEKKDICIWKISLLFVKLLKS